MSSTSPFPEDSDLGRSIKLPASTEVAFRHIKNAKIFAMDIGGSLTKIAYYSTLPIKRVIYDGEANDGAEMVNNEDASSNEVRYEVSEGARLHFIKFENVHIKQCLEYISQRLVGKGWIMIFSFYAKLYKY